MFLHKKNKLYFVALPLLVVLFSGNKLPTASKISTNIHLSKLHIINPCPADDEINRAILKEFLTESYWSSARQETNTDQLTTSQINLLQTKNSCETLNDHFKGFISDKWSDGATKYNVTYYKISDYFFVVVTLRQPDDPGKVVSGDAYLDIYDENMNRIKGYAF